MKKKEKRSLINETFLTWVVENFPEYHTIDDEDKNIVRLINKNYPNEHMSYNRFHHYIVRIYNTYKYSSTEILEHETLFNNYIQTVIIPEADRLEQLS
jgi:hypothetical protein